MASATDTTPLLADSEPLEAGEYQIPQDDTITSPQQEKPPFFRTIIVLTHLSAALSIIAFVFDLAVICIDYARLGGWYMFWNLCGDVQGLFFLTYKASQSIITFVASSINLAHLRYTHRPLWLRGNMLFDAVVVAYTIALAPEGLSLNFNQSPDSWLPDKRAANTARAAMVLLGIGLVAGSLLGLVHLILIPVRCYASYKNGSWRRPPTLTLPGGEFKIEFSIKFVRQESSRDSRVAEL
ncbi:hypothetical protein BJX76DRAFT_363931 [Aspergillus varians]